MGLHRKLSENWDFNKIILRGLKLRRFTHQINPHLKVSQNHHSVENGKLEIATTSYAHAFKGNYLPTQLLLFFIEISEFSVIGYQKIASSLVSLEMGFEYLQ